MEFCSNLHLIMVLVPSGVLLKFAFMVLVPSGVLLKFAFMVLVPSGVLLKFAFMVLVPSGVLSKFAFMDGSGPKWSFAQFFISGNYGPGLKFAFMIAAIL